MKIKKNIYIAFLLITSISAFSQSVTFQSYMQTIPWAEDVLLNGSPLIESSPGIFDIDASDVLAGTNSIKVVSLPGSLNGVSTLDIVLTTRAIQNIEPLQATGIIGADVNQSNFIGIEDLAIHRNRILGSDTDYTFAFVHNSVDVGSLDIFDFGSDVYTFYFEGSDLGTIDFTFDVYQAGDVNYNAQLVPEEVAETRSGDLTLQLSETQLTAGEIIEIPFSFNAENDIEGLQFSIENKGFDVESISLENSDHKIYFNSLENQTKLLLVSENPSNEIKGIMNVKCNVDGSLTDMISISNALREEVVYSDLSLGGVSIAYDLTSVNTIATSDNLKVYPNPIQEYLSITIPENLNQISTFKITDMKGQIVKEQSTRNSNLVIDRAEIGNAGMYILTWTYGNESVQRKIVVQ